MKKNIANRLWCCLFGSLLLGPVYAQPNGQVAQASIKSPDRTHIMSVVTTSADVDARVQRSFERLFKDAQNPYWSRSTNKKGVPGNKYAVYFKTGDRRALALFGEKGNMIHKILYGTVSHLPQAEKELLKSYYAGYRITHADHVTTSADELWVVSLQNCTDYIKVRIMNGEVDELKRYKLSE